MFVNSSTDNMHCSIRNIFKFYYFFLLPYLDYTKKSFLKIKLLHFSDYTLKGVIYMIRVREDIALVDQLVLNNIEILHITDIEQLISRNIVEISTKPMQYTMADGMEFTRLQIVNDGVIDRLCAGAIYKPNRKINYCDLSLSVQSTIGNLYCHTADNYKTKLMEIKKHLWITYGILISIENAAIKTIEINRTFLINEPYSSYHRVLEVMMHNLPKELKNKMQTYNVKKDSNQNRTYYAGSSQSKQRYTEIKIYDKSAQLSSELQINLSESYMRVEIRFSGSQNIKRAFGTRYLSKITDDMINLCYNKKMTRYFFNPYKRWLRNRNDYLIKLMKEQRSIDIRHWQVNFLRILSNEEITNGFATLLDITELFPLLKSKKLNLTPKRQYQIKKNFQRHVKDYEIVFNQKDNEKLNELLQKIGYSK